MRLPAVVALLLLVASSAQAGIIAFYPFDDGPENAAGAGLDGVVNGATLTAAGFEGGAYEFDGVNDFIEVPLDINPAVLPQLTVGAWANTDATNVIRTIVSHDSGSFDRTLVVDPRGAGAGGRYSAFAGPVANVLSAGPDPAPIGEWVFVAARYDAIAETVTLDVGTDRVTVSAAPGDGFNITNIGRNPGFNEFWDGRIDNVFFANRVLTDAEIDTIRLGGAAEILALVPEPSSFAMVLIAGVAACRVSNARVLKRPAGLKS